MDAFVLTNYYLNNNTEEYLVKENFHQMKVFLDSEAMCRRILDYIVSSMKLSLDSEAIEPKNLDYIVSLMKVFLDSKGN